MINCSEQLIMIKYCLIEGEYQGDKKNLDRCQAHFLVNVAVAKSMSFALPTPNSFFAGHPPISNQERQRTSDPSLLPCAERCSEK